MSSVPPACSLQGASRASVFLMPTLSCFLFLSLQGDIRRHPSSPSHQLSPWRHQASGPQQGHTRPAARSLQQAGSFQRPFSSLALVACLAVPRWSVAVEDPGSGVLMDACLALVPTAALISSEAEVSLYIRFLQMVSRPASPVHGCPSVSCPCSSSSALSA